ncbi:MAG: trypsin-like serine protease [Stackebrandtia sp.]
MSTKISDFRWRRLLSASVVGLAALALAGLSASPAHADNTSGSDDGAGTTIVGGGPASEPYEYTAALLSGGRQVCGGTLIAPKWVVTAAHCVSSGLSVRLASHYRHSGGVVVSAQRYIRHPSYGGVNGGNDIALLELSRTVEVVPIPIADQSPAPGTSIRLLGWGQTCPTRGCNGGSETLKQLDTSVISSNNCATARTGDLCISSTSSSTACYGDSGGPALVRGGSGWELAGATSRAGGNNPTCGPTHVVYTSVPHFYDWIDQYVDFDQDPGDPGDPETDWRVGTYYSAGDRVTYNGTTYQCRISHTAYAGWEPPNTPSLWQPAS